jgi:VWFA-related protein
MKRLPAVLAGISMLTGILAIAGRAQFRIEVAVDLVNVNFSAMDKKGRMLPGLTVDDFTIEEDGKKQTITSFARERELPLTLAMLVDISPSIAPVFDEEKHTASGFFKSVIGPRDLALVITFDRWVTLVQDYTEHLPDLTEAVESLRVSKGGTSLFDAVYLAADEKLSREAGRKAIVLISDGEDTTSTYNASRALIAAHRSNAVIYTISNSGNSKTMRELAEDTGGAFFRIRKEGDFQNVFDQISLELRTQYSIAYQSSNTVRDGGFRRIRIIPKDPSISVRARRGYYAPKEGERR